MSAFRHSVRSLLSLSLVPATESPLENRLSELIAEHVRAKVRRNPSPAERRSWDRSLPKLAADLDDAGLGQLEMLVEYQLPQTSRCADVVLAGIDRTTGTDRYLVVELKQWSHAELYEDDDALVLVEGVKGGPRLHPLLQVEGYCDYLADFLTVLADRPEAIGGVAYLHNASDLDVHDLFGRVGSERTRLFTGSRRGAFLDYLREQFSDEPGAAAADRLLASPVAPSRQLMAAASAQLRTRDQFVLLEKQRLAYEQVMHAVRSARRADSKEVMIITGGPGSGKSVIAVTLLADLMAEQRTVLHATGSRSFTQTMRRHVAKGSARFKSVFKYFNDFMTAERNSLDVLICDEAHRIREASFTQYTPARLRSGRPQVDELIAVARVPVFLLDEHQVVRPGELGSLHEITEHAEGLGLAVRHIALDDQFRCGGSRAYEQWVLDLLGLDGGQPQAWAGDDHFEVLTASGPTQLESMLREQFEAGLSARMTAGFCWPWSDPTPDLTLVSDVRIGAWSRPWNVKGDRSIGSAPASALWATADGGFDQVGCVYTAQGFEYDWNGVIFGPDLVARDGRLVTVRSASADPALKKKITEAQADRLIRNTYKVLLTRGMRGTVLHSVDNETQDFLDKLVGAAGLDLQHFGPDKDFRSSLNRSARSAAWRLIRTQEGVTA